jgi:hypothetical protein
MWPQLRRVKLFMYPSPELFGAIIQRSCQAIHTASISRQFTHIEDPSVHSPARCQGFHHDSQSHFTEWCGRPQWVLPILLPNEKTFSTQHTITHLVVLVLIISVILSLIHVAIHEYDYPTSSRGIQGDNSLLLRYGLRLLARLPSNENLSRTLLGCDVV